MKGGVNRSQKSSICVDFHHQWQFLFNEDLFLHHKACFEAKTQNSCLEFLYTHVSVCNGLGFVTHVLKSLNLQHTNLVCKKKTSWDKFSGADGTLYFVHLKVGKFCSCCVAQVHHLFIKANIILEFLVGLLLCIKFCNWSYVLRFFIVKSSDTANIFQ